MSEDLPISMKELAELFRVAEDRVFTVADCKEMDIKYKTFHPKIEGSLSEDTIVIALNEVGTASDTRKFLNKVHPGADEKSYHVSIDAVARTKFPPPKGFWPHLKNGTVIANPKATLLTISREMLEVVAANKDEIAAIVDEVQPTKVYPDTAYRRQVLAEREARGRDGDEGRVGGS